MKNNVIIVWLGMILCFYMSIHSVNRYFHSRRPVAQPGECISIVVNDNSDRVTLQVIKNDNKAYKSTVMSESNGAMVDFTYGELRELEAEKVNCEKV